VEGLEGSTGSIDADTYLYGAYGQEQTTAAGDAKENPFRFQGHYFDEDLQSYDMQARMYRPELGRFLSPDRYESSTADLGLQLNPQTNNRYAFLGGNPVDQMEIDGHKAADCMTCPLGRAPTDQERAKEREFVEDTVEAEPTRRSWNNYYGSQDYWAATTTQGKSATAQEKYYSTFTMKPAFNQLGCHHRPGVICNEARPERGSWTDVAGGASCEFSIGIVCFGDPESSAYKAGGIIVMLNPKGLVQAGGKSLVKEGVEEVAESKFGRETLGLMPDKRSTDPGYGVKNTPTRISGPWKVSDLKRGATGRAPRTMSETDIHHADQMPGSGVHEIPRDVHRRDSSVLHPNKHNQGVTDEMRTKDRQLHWWYRSQEMGGRDVLGEEYFYDNWPG
jgi:RHS repeat-associated protein